MITKVRLYFELKGDFTRLSDEKLTEIVLGLYGKGEMCKLTKVEHTQPYPLKDEKTNKYGKEV